MLPRLIQRLTIAALFMLTAASGAWADLFTSPPVPVDVRAESAQAAQAEAMAQARAAGLRQVMMRLTAEEDHQNLPVVEGETLERMVTALQISDEKTAPDRYIAQVSFQFDAESVRQLLRANNIAFTEARALPILIIPVLTEGGEPSIWTDPSPWLEAWARQDGSQHLVPPLVPFGDIEDVISLTPEQALAGDEAAILALARRYGAESALVVHAILDIDPVNRNATVDIFSQSFGPDQYQPIDTAFSGAATEGTESFLAAIAELLMGDISSQWKAATIRRFAIENRLTAVVPVTGLRDWLDMSATINRIHLVRQQDLKALSVRDAVVELTYGGEPALLLDAMTRAGLTMEQQPDGFWLLKRREQTQ